MALFRPHPGTSRRHLFNWAHFVVGTLGPLSASEETISRSVALTKFRKTLTPPASCHSPEVGSDVLFFPHSCHPHTGHLLDSRSDERELQVGDSGCAGVAPAGRAGALRAPTVEPDAKRYNFVLVHHRHCHTKHDSR